MLVCCCCSVVSVMSDSVQPYGLQPARLLYLWDSLGKSTRVGCHALRQGSSRPKDRTWVSCIAGRFFTAEPPGKPNYALATTNLFLFHHSFVFLRMSYGRILQCVTFCAWLLSLTQCL